MLHGERMKKMISMRYFPFIVVAALLWQGCGQARNGGGENKTESGDFYSAEDFVLVEKFDTHIHLNTTDTAFIEQSAADKFSFLDIVDVGSRAPLLRLEHEVRSITHPLFGRPLVNRNPEQTNRNYRPGRDAFVP